MNLGLENSPKIALHKTPVIFVGAVRHHNQDINVLIVVAPSQVPRPSCELGNLTRWHPIWVVAQIQMQE